MQNPINTVIAWFVGVLLIIGVIICLVWEYQSFRVFSASQSGKAQLAEAEYSKQIIVTQAQAKLDAAGLEAQAAVKHAQGVADSNKIIANDLGGPEGYLRFLYIQMLSDQQDKQIIYVPTEAGLPILEAGKR